MHSEASFTLRAGELARLCGVSTDTLRHYERVGVLARPLRTRAGYRQYPAEALLRVRVVRRALAIGFTLAELSKILRTRDRGGAPCREVREIIAGKRGDHVMGFSDEKTTHHLRLYRDGGAIEVTATTLETAPAATRFVCTWVTSQRCSPPEISMHRC